MGHVDPSGEGEGGVSGGPVGVWVPVAIANDLGLFCDEDVMIRGGGDEACSVPLAAGEAAGRIRR